MKRYGIIGKPLEHSFSCAYFTDKFAREGIDARYEVFEVDDLPHWFESEGCSLDGFNVTSPYKVAVMPMLDELDEKAREIGAVNVVKVMSRDGQTFSKGYNTDWYGFMYSIRPILQAEDKRAMILGTGGAAKAVRYALTQLGIESIYVTRKKVASKVEIAYSDITKSLMNEYSVIVNATPLGMYPDVDEQPPIPYEYLGKGHLLFDCIYNPEETAFLRMGSRHGARTVNGMEMLVKQAEQAWKIWNKRQ